MRTVVKGGLGFFIVIIVVAFIVISRNSYWDGISRFRLVVGNPEGNVSYILFDPKRDEARVFSIDKTVEVEAAYGLGKWKVESLWKLGEQENKGGGDMLSKSLVRGYGLPVEGVLRYSGGPSAFPLARTLLLPRETDLPFADRVRLAWFILRARLTDSGQLKLTSLILAGEEVSAITDGIVTISSPNTMRESQLRSVNTLIANLGGKVLDVSTLTEEVSGKCLVKGHSSFAEKLAKILGCGYSSTSEENTYLLLGEAFVAEF